MSELICPACGEPAAQADARFCEACRTPLRDDVRPAAATAKGCQCAPPKLDADGFCENCGLRIAPAPAPPEYEEAVDANLAVASDKGRRHPTNQDFGGVARREDGAALVVVCDGVSSSDNAEGASRAAVAAVKALFLGPQEEPASLGEQARACVAAASTAVLATPMLEETYDDGPASTIVVAMARAVPEHQAIEYAIAWVGDSRAYLVAPAVPETLLTRDDSWCMQEVDAGRLTYEQAIHDPNAHAITQWLGMDPGEMRINLRQSVMPVGASLLICSDGLWNHADGAGRLARAFTEASADEDDAAGICRRLVNFANAAGGNDNITVGLFRA